MNAKFKKLMRKQIQENLSAYTELARRPLPQKGWIRAIREALNIPTKALARKLRCSPSNITSIEQREQKKTITLETLEEVAKAMNCALVYCLVPSEPLEAILEKQARVAAHKKIQLINHSMSLEEQGLNKKQLKEQEDELVQELLQGNLKNIWIDDEV